MPGLRFFQEQTTNHFVKKNTLGTWTLLSGCQMDGRARGAILSKPLGFKHHPERRVLGDETLLAIRSPFSTTHPPTHHQQGTPTQDAKGAGQSVAGHLGDVTQRMYATRCVTWIIHWEHTSHSYRYV